MWAVLLWNFGSESIRPNAAAVDRVSDSLPVSLLTVLALSNVSVIIVASQTPIRIKT